MRRVLFLLTLVAAMVFACAGVVLAQSTEQRTPPEKGAQATNSRVDAHDIEKRGPPELKLPSNQSSEESVSGQEATSPALAQEATTQTSEQRANGAFVGPDVWADPATKITNFTNMVGTPPHVIMYYQNWEQPEK